MAELRDNAESGSPAPWQCDWQPLGKYAPPRTSLAATATILQATDVQGVLHHAGLFDIFAREFRDQPIEIARLLATTELTLKLPAWTSRGDIQD